VLGEHLEPLAEELGWLADKLGAVRDLDVLIAHLRDEVAEVDEEARGAESIVTALEEEREARREELLAALDSDRYIELLRSFVAAIDSLPELDGDVRALALAELKRLDKAASSVTKDSSDEDLHTLRIRAKRARYAAELAALAGGKKLTRYVEAVTALQDVVGEHQDAVVAEEKLRELVAPDRAVAVGRLIERERERRRDARARYSDVVTDPLARGRAALS
jgi:CHAD domain-containing protein